MLRTRRVCLACAVTVFVCLMAAPASAQPADNRTTFTFSGPVTMPGITLPAGEYLIPTRQSGYEPQRHTGLERRRHEAVRAVLCAAGRAIRAHVHARSPVHGNAGGKPVAIRTWWYPGNRTGYEFIYPKGQARTLARSASESVLTTQAQTTRTEETNTGDLSRIASGGQETPVSAGATPARVTPLGETQAGQMAASSITVPIPVVPAIGRGPRQPRARVRRSCVSGQSCLERPVACR